VSKSELYDLLAYLDLEQYEKVVPEIEKKDKEIERLKEDKEELQGYYDILNHQCIEQGLEIERLNNIINDLEKESYLGMLENQNNNDYSKGIYTAYKYINDKIKELKGSDKNEY